MGGGTGGGGATWSEFQSQLLRRLAMLAGERRSKAGEEEEADGHLVMPVGLLLTIDEANGGDVTAQELVRRFDLLHQESGNLVDFYFMGWKWIKAGDRCKGIQFDLAAFNECRQVLNKAGVKKFGGNSDLILVDAHYHSNRRHVGDVSLDFSEAVRINLSSRRADADIPPVGELLQMIIDAAGEVRDSMQSVDTRYVFAISDKLGLATAKESFLTFILEKFGGLIGGKKLKTLATTNLGPIVKLSELDLEGVFR